MSEDGTPTPCPTCGKPLEESDPFLDGIMRRRGFLFCMSESCSQPTIEKPLSPSLESPQP